MRDSSVCDFASLPCEIQVILCSFLPIKTMRALSMTTSVLFNNKDVEKLQDQFYFSALSIKVKSDANYNTSIANSRLRDEVFEYNEVLGKKLDYGFLIRKNNPVDADKKGFVFLWKIDICSFINNGDDGIKYEIRSAEACVHRNGRVEMFRCENDPADFSVDITNDFNRFLSFRSDFHFSFSKQAALVKKVESDKNYRPNCTDDKLLTEIIEYNKCSVRRAMVDSFVIQPFDKDMKDFSKYFKIHFWAYENIGDSDMPYYCWQMHKYVSKITGHGNSYVYKLSEDDEIGSQISYFPTIESFLGKRFLAGEISKGDQMHAVI